MAKTKIKKKRLLNTKRSVETPIKLRDYYKDYPRNQSKETNSQERGGIKKPNLRTIFFGVLLVGLLTLFFFNKNILIAAMVNGKPIFRWQLNKTMVSRYGQQTLEGMIGELLIVDAATSVGVAVKQETVDAKVAEIVGSLGDNVDITELLRLQGMTRDEFENQIRLQLTVERVLAKDFAATDKDIEQFIATNSGRFTATDAATIRLQARQAIIDEYVSGRFQPWFTQLKEKATITRYL
jgi:parvulin-like peptidyl-prolyl isomerase